MSKQMFHQFAALRRIRTQDQFDLAVRLAKMDDHPVIAPTHVVMKEGNQIGYFCINGLPIWFGHLSKELTNPNDTFRLIHHIEESLIDAGNSQVMTLVGTESKLHPKMADLGYGFVGNADIFVKGLI